ncbi:methyl-accepting chemotaxis protein [Merismopedia glauca]|uniref:Methyl-accepting chemotaxis protein n=1 Tax=Merismopedia glauca CCAP 1448/3 TaxID=1296344 RepID=A0A2T1BY08_9CYAN|nr:methyl-accepting chemotaxis protein [Merismopedia glauca]PSB00807.1 methyl-accepting chemotaxis protein [Merismopedia glauca CCAP 1448/3]
MNANNNSFLRDFNYIPKESNESLDKKLSGSGNTLRRRLLLMILPTVLVPLAVASAIGFNVTQKRVINRELRQIQESSQLTSEASSVFLEQAFKIPNLVANNPLMVDALRRSAQQAEAQKLPQQEIEKNEAQFKSTKLLQPNTVLNGYLENAVKEATLAEMFLTERNGFNVAFSNPTSDFVQSDEKWWQNAKSKGRFIGNPEFDDSAKAVVVAISQAIKDPTSGKFLGVIKTGVPATNLDENLATYLSSSLVGSKLVQTLDSSSGTTINTISAKGISQSQQEVVGGKTLIKASQLLDRFAKNPDLTLEQLRQQLEAEEGITNVVVERLKHEHGIEVQALLEYEDKIFSLTTIPLTEWVAIASIDAAEVSAPGLELLGIFSLTALVLGGAAIGIILLLSQQLSKPLGNLTKTAQQVADGNLDTQAELVGTIEVQSLAQTFNSLVNRVKNLLQDQKQQSDSLETAIFQLVNDVEGAMDGDLTVRANLNSMEMSTVADIFNAIIDNLRDIAVQVRESTGKVNTSLETNEESIRLLSEKAVTEALEIRNTLGSIKQMTQSIQTVATSADRASAIADRAYTNAQEGSAVMVQTVDSILNLRTTVGETAKKMKRLGESSQKISQVVALIEEIALKTNLLAINASVEASRAGEQGQGFTVVAEQVGALAEQSAAATREIAQIVAAIQAETQDVATVMELGTSQVVDSSRLVESTNQRLIQVLEESQKINELMRSISEATVSQSETAQTVTQLMQQVTEASDERSAFSSQMASSIQETSQVAKKLAEKVAQFQV